jgi:prolyl-tRNA synthetase
MRLSQYFLPLIKENPSEAAIVSHRLMLRAGMVRQLSSGIYNWLPLGLKVLKKIEQIIREEMNEAGAVELLMPTMQPAQLWQESGRYDDYGKEMLRVTDRHDHAMLYGPTNEEVLTDIFRQNVKSYKDLPMNLYQIQWKFRDEIRPRFGVMRGREFYMKDAYSFDIDAKSARESYEIMFKAYIKTFRRLGLKAIPVRADNGAIGGDLSHEFQILAETGESQLYYDRAFESHLDQEDVDFDKLVSLYAAADEMHDSENCPVASSELLTQRGIEVGHIFNFGLKYSEAMKAAVPGPDGKDIYPNMGSYGIGVSRLVGAIIESSHDENGIIWPKSVAPFDVALINIRPQDEECSRACEELYQKLKSLGLDVLYDDTADSAGKKFAAMDLIGIPAQLAIGPRGLKDNKVEFKKRGAGIKQELALGKVETIVESVRNV